MAEPSIRYAAISGRSARLGCAKPVAAAIGGTGGDQRDRAAHVLQQRGEQRKARAQPEPAQPADRGEQPPGAPPVPE